MPEPTTAKIVMTALSATAAPPPPRVQAYVDAIVCACAVSGRALVSVVLFGSAAAGGFSATASDVDLIFIVRDDATQEDSVRLRKDVARLEALHGFRVECPHPGGTFKRFVDRVTA